MLVDIQTVQPLKAIPLSQVLVVDFEGSLTLEIRGTGFSAIDEVLINGQESPSVIVRSASQMYAQLPASLQNIPQINDVVVLSKTLKTSAANVFRYRIGNSPGRVTGLFRLLQLFVKILVSNKGSDSFYPWLGGGLYRAVGANISALDEQSVKGIVVEAVSDTTRQVIRLQSAQRSLLPEERLVGTEIESVTFQRSTASCFATFVMQTQAGTNFRSNLDLF